MNFIKSWLTDWLKELLVSGIMSNLTGLFDQVNEEVSGIATEVGTTPSEFLPDVFNLIKNLSENLILPIAGIVLTFVCTWELIQLIIDQNNLSNFDTWIFFKWIFKTFIAVLLITNCFNITMAVFDVAQSVIASSGDLISGSTAVDAQMLENLEETLNGLDLGQLLGIWLESFIIGVTTSVLAVVIFVIIYGRLIEIYLMVSLAPIPFATMVNREQGQVGQNYLKSLLALGFQGFLIMVCVAVYAVMIQSISISEEMLTEGFGLFSIVGYTVLLVFTLFRTGSLSKAIFGAH